MKKFLLGTLSLIATVACTAGDVVSVNFGSNSGAVSGDSDVGLVAGVPGTSWNNLSAQVGTNTTLRSISQETVDGLKLAWTCQNLYNYSTDVTDAFLKGYLDDTGNKLSISLEGIPFTHYDVIVYMASDNANKKFGAVKLNGKPYFADATTGEARWAYSGTASWGATRAATAAYGTNAVRVNGLGGSTLSIVPISQSYSYYRCAIAAIQIVENTSNWPMAPDFAWSGVPASAPTGWMTSFGQNTTKYQRVGPLGKDVFATRNGNAPYAGKGWGKDFSMCLYADISDIGSETKDSMILDMGGVSASSRALALLRKKGTDDVELVYVNGTGGGVYTKSETLVTVPDVGLGYHLFFVTFSTTEGISLRVDDRETVSLATSCSTLTSGFQLGDTYGSQNTAVAANGMGVAGLWGWDYILSEADKDQILHLYADGRVGAPFIYDYTSDLNVKDANIYVPTMTATNGIYYGVSYGTANLQSSRVVSVPQLRMGYATSNVTSVLNVYGTFNVSSTSTTARVTDELASFRGSSLAGKAKTSCTVNVKSGGLFNSPDAYLCLNATGGDVTEYFTVDGIARVRGFFMNSGSARITVQNGGLLEVADFNNGVQSLSCAAGTIRAVAYTNGTPIKTGWTHPAAASCSFNDQTTGTTIDVNGMTNTLASIITGSGKLIVADSSEEKGGKLIITQMPSFAGTIVVEDGLELDIGANRPLGTFEFGEGSRLILRESLADTNGVAGISFTGSPIITMYRADGTTVIEDAVIVAEEGSEPYIRYTATTTPLVSGEGCWLDFEFDDYSYTSSGYNKLTLTREGNYGIGMGVANGDFKDAYSIYAASQVYMTLVYPTQWSAAIYATVPNYPNAAVMTFGTCKGGLIGLIGGDNDNEVKLVRTTGDSAYITLATMSVPNASTAQHLYVFTKKGRTIGIYLDGVLWQTYTADADITIGNGFQMASVHGSVGNTGIKRFGSPDIKGALTNELLTASYVGMLRMYDIALSGTALATLAAEFPYISPNGLYARTLTGGAETWTSEDAWTLMAENEADRTQTSTPAASAALQIAGAADGTSALTVDLDAETRFESLTVGGAGAVRFVHGANAAQAVNEGKTVLNVDTTIEYGAITVNGGPLSLADGATLTFDWSGFPTTHDLVNQTNQVTGITTATAVEFIPPTNTLGRTFTCYYNADNSTWCVSITRPAYALEWKGTDSTWNTSTLWRNAATGEDAAFLPMDAVTFPNTPNASETIAVSGTQNVRDMTFSASTTDYTLSGGALNLWGLSSTASSSIVIANTVNIKASCAMSFGSGVVDLRDLRTRQRNDVSFANGTGDTLARISDNSASNVFNTLTYGTGRRPVYDARKADNRAYVYGAITAPADTTFVKTGAGKFDVLADSPEFRSGLRIEDGQFLLHANLRNLMATRENPIRITGGSLYVTHPNGGDVSDHQQRLPDQAWIDVSGGGKFEASGNNPFSRAAGMGPTIVAHEGGIVQFNGEDTGFDVRVESVELADSELRISGTMGNWGGHTVQITGGTITSGGESQITQASETSGTINFTTLAVTNGVLTFGARASTNVATLVKTGAGALVLEGAGGCAATARHLEIAEGTIRANAALADNIKTLTLDAGTVLDLSTQTEAFNAAGSLDFDVAAGSMVVVDTGTRDLAIGDKLLAWGTQGAPAGGLRLRSSKHGSYRTMAKNDGLYVMDGGTLLLFR